MDNLKPLRKVGTHNGRFHADEVMATAILKEIYEIDLTRTRDAKTLSGLDIVYDVGGGKFDHHGVEKVYREDGIPFAACGLIWNEFGKALIKFKEPSLNEREVDSIVNYIDRVLIEGIDALDNGVKISEEIVPLMNVSAVISGFNPPWYSNENEDEAFKRAVDAAAAILGNTINRRFSVLRARNLVVKAFENRKNQKLLILGEYCPYGEILRDIDENKEVLFVIYSRKDSYAMQTVRGAGGEDRKLLPKAWAGRRDKELAAITGVHDAVFCHSGRFIAVAESFEGITKMAELALAEPEERKESGFFGFIKRLFRKH